MKNADKGRPAPGREGRFRYVDKGGGSAGGRARWRGEGVGRRAARALVVLFRLSSRTTKGDQIESWERRAARVGSPSPPRARTSRSSHATRSSSNRYMRRSSLSSDGIHASPATAGDFQDCPSSSSSRPPAEPARPLSVLQCSTGASGLADGSPLQPCRRPVITACISRWRGARDDIDNNGARQPCPSRLVIKPPCLPWVAPPRGALQTPSPRPWTRASGWCFARAQVRSGRFGGLATLRAGRRYLDKSACHRDDWRLRAPRPRRTWRYIHDGRAVYASQGRARGGEESPTGRCW